MKEVTEIGSGLLFVFAKRALQAKMSVGKIRDQDLGGLIGKAPAETSHWKKGRVRIRSIEDYFVLASRLDIDVKYLYDIASEQTIPDEIRHEYQLLKARNPQTRNTKPREVSAEG